MFSPCGLVCGAGWEGQTGGLVGVVRQHGGCLVGRLVALESWQWGPRVWVLCGLGLVGWLVAGGCDLAWWMWLAWRMLCRAWVGRPARYGARMFLGLPFLGVCALVW